MCSDLVKFLHKSVSQIFDHQLFFCGILFHKSQSLLCCHITASFLQFTNYLACSSVLTSNFSKIIEHREPTWIFNLCDKCIRITKILKALYSKQVLSNELNFAKDNTTPPYFDVLFPLRWLSAENEMLYSLLWTTLLLSKETADIGQYELKVHEQQFL